MNRCRIAVYSALLCLPALLLIGVWAYYLMAEMPVRIRAQQSRVGREYRRMASEFIAHPEKAKLGRRPKGLRKTSEINGYSWGHYTAEGRGYVWIQSAEKEWRCTEVALPDEFPYEAVFYLGGGVTATVLVLLSGLTVWCFTRFVKERNDFLAATAHDLTTPLVGMRYLIGRNDEEARHLNERMIRLVANIKDFLQLGRRPEPQAQPFDLIHAYRDAYLIFAEDYRELLGEKDIELEIDGDDSGRVMAFADEIMTVQILWNLLGNDLKYAAPYGRVWARVRSEGRRVTFELLDEGQGMTPRQMRKAFDRYYRAKTVLKSGKGGFGIGLCTAREFAKAMGGSLEVRANEPHGCIFTLSLPAPI